MNLEQACNTYVNNIRIIRQLANISTDITLTEESFYNEMVSNFMKIREYSSQIQDILNNIILPKLDINSSIDEEEIKVLEGFIDELINGYSMHNLDLEIVSKCVTKLLVNASIRNDFDDYIKQLDNSLTTYYTLMNKSERIYEQAHVKEYYRDLGKNTAIKLKAYLNKDLFNTISNESKNLVLIDSRYCTALHEAVYNNHEDNALEIEELKNTMALYNDEFYRNNITDFDWDVHLAACCEYAGYMLERNNAKNMTVEECQWVYERILELHELRKVSPITKERISDEEYSLLYIRSAYFSNNITFEEYTDSLWTIYKRRKSGYDITSIFTNLLIPVEYLMALKNKELTTKQLRNIERIYDDLINYAINMPNGETMSYVLEYYSLVLDNYIEHEDLMTFKDFSLKSIASLHLPTYIHSSMVAKISYYITDKFIEHDNSILNKLNMTKEELLDYIYNAGLLHDVGKLPVIDTVYVYERKLFDIEFAVLKTHSRLGYNLLKKYKSTEKYANIAYSHHIWNNKKGGYPESIELSELEQFATDIIRCADCLDAATDVVGRSYRGGITLEQYAKEYIAGSGTLYAGYIADLFTNEFVGSYTDLLNKERKRSYFTAFNYILKS